MNLCIPFLRAAYASRELTVDTLVEAIYTKILGEDQAIWITLLERGQIEVYLRRLRMADPRSLPLYGIPFAIKDNIDLAGAPTTAACPAYAYVPQQSAYVVQRLIDAGAIPLGKTNLDQFATGLVGTRSPYGVPQNAFNPEFIAGGSSSGSAVAVAKGLVSFALGTDTAGSGRVPASFNNIFGIKPSCGILSTSGVVPACRSLDCVSIFSLTAADADAVLSVAAHFDPQDAFMRRAVCESVADGSASAAEVGGTQNARVQTIGIPRRGQLDFFGDVQAQRLFDEAVAGLERMGLRVRQIDFEPFLEAARLLYGGPWLAERYIVAESLLNGQPEALLDVTRQIIEGGNAASAVDAFRADYKLRALKRLAQTELETVDAIMAPTTGTVYRVSEVRAEPFAFNTNLGRYTNFMNLLDLAAVASPSGFRSDGQPLGVTFFAPCGQDRMLLQLGGMYHAACGLQLGASEVTVPPWHTRGDGAATGGNVQNDVRADAAPAGSIHLVVCGAHMDGLVLNHQLQELGATFVERTVTTSDYRFYRLAGEPMRPALVRSPGAAEGRAIEVEVWQVGLSRVGRLLPKIGAPLGLGKVFLEDGRQEVGFIADATATLNALEITAFGGWRCYLQSLTDANR